MRTYSRWMVIVAAIVLVVAGGVVGWLISILRTGNPSDAIVSAIVTGAFTLLGAAMGLLVPMVQDWDRNRPNLKLQVSYHCVHAKVSFQLAAGERLFSTFTASNPPPMVQAWIRAKPDDEDAWLVIFLNVQIQNRSHLDDAVTEITLELPFGGGSAQLRPSLMDGSSFLGESVPAHQLRPLRLCQMIDPVNFNKTPNWIPKPDVVWRLVCRTINDQDIVEDIRPAGHFMAYVEGPISELDEWRI